MLGRGLLGGRGSASVAPLTVALMQAVAGRLLITVRQPLDAPVHSVELSMANGGVAQGVVLASVPITSAVILALDLDSFAALPLFDARLEIALLDADGAVRARGSAALTRLGIDADGLAPGHRTVIERVLAEGVFQPPVAAALRWRIATREPETTAFAHLEHGVPLGGGAAIEGWVANLGERRLLILSDGLESVRFGGEVATFERPEVSRDLIADGTVVTTDRHGFVTTLPLFRPGDRGFLLFEERGEEVAYLARLSWDGAQRGHADEVLGAVLRRLGDGEFLSPARARSHLRPLLARVAPDFPAYDLLEVIEKTEVPALSIIVPLFGNPLLLRGLLENQSALPEGAEVVLVSDDPDLHAFARDYVLDRRPLLARPTRLLLDHANYGFSVANNLGVREARAPVLLFMNSDIRVEDGAGLADGLAALREEKFGIVGFRLLFEDGTIQHDGMAFQRHRRLHDLFTAEHPGKGLPPGDPGAGAVAAVEAVTGAMMMIGRDWFDRLGGFDSGYVRGDFEDGDLCLRSVEAGRPVGITRAGRIRHLERQSIVASGRPGMRQAITYLNCLRFNEGWGERLGSAG